MNLYSILGLARDPPPSPEVVRRAYKAAAKKAHPDKGGSAEKFAAIVKARDILSDAKRKDKYDRTGDDGEATADQGDADALVKVMATLDFVFGEVDRRRLRREDVDVIADAVTTLRAELQALEQQVREIRKAAERIRKLAARFHRRGEGPNRISPMIEARALDTERAIARQEPTVAACKRAIEILNDHTYELG